MGIEGYLRQLQKNYEYQFEERAQELNPKMRNLILHSASELINKDRAKDYGDAKESFDRIAKMWSAYLGIEICGADVALMMNLLKVCRARVSPLKRDSYDDMAGYAALAGELATQEAQNEIKKSI